MRKLTSTLLGGLTAIALGACAAPSTPSAAPTGAPVAAPTAAPAAPTAAGDASVTATPAPTTPAAAPTAAAGTVDLGPAPTIDPATLPDAAATAASALAGTTWRLTFLGSQEEPTKAATGLNGTLTFGPDGSLSASTACGELSGTYAADEAVLAVPSLSSRELSCDDAELQAQAALALGLLSRADGYSIEGAVLEITAGDNALWLQSQ